MQKEKCSNPLTGAILVLLLLIALPGIALAATVQEIRDTAIKIGLTEAQSAKALGGINYQTPPPVVLGYIGYGVSKDKIAKSSQEIRDYAIKNGGTEVQAGKR